MLPFSGRYFAYDFGKSPDLWVYRFFRLPSVYTSGIIEVTSHLQWPDRSGFSPDSFLIFAG